MVGEGTVREEDRLASVMEGTEDPTAMEAGTAGRRARTREARRADAQYDDSQDLALVSGGRVPERPALSSPCSGGVIRPGLTPRATKCSKPAWCSDRGA